MTRLRSGLLPWLLAAAAGLLQAFALAWPGDGRALWWLQWLSLAVLAGLLQRQGGWRTAAALGWVFGTTWLVGTFWWLFISMHVYGGLAAPLAAVAVLLLALFLSLYYAAAAGLYAAGRSGGVLRDGALFAGLWLGAELLRVKLFTGFPWGEGGYAHVDGPLASLAPWIGVHGISAVAAGIAYLIALAAQRGVRGSWRYWVAVAATAGLLAACNLQAPGTDGPNAGPVLRVALLQGNIPQDEKFEGGTGIPVALDWYGRTLASADAQLVVAPETAIPVLPQQLPAGYLQGLAAAFAQGQRAALVGIPLGSFETGYTNSAIALQPGGAEYRYDKHHLVPFGEFIPPLFKWFTRMMNIPLGDFNRGDVGQPSFAWAGQRLAPNICYEDLFGEELAARFRDPAAAPTIFVNLSNIAWFGDSIAIDQHLHISRMRALEFDRPMIRATNTGATAIIDRSGQVTRLLQRHTRGVLVGDVEGGTAMTPYARWAAVAGLWPWWAIAAAALLVALRRLRRRARP